MDNAMRGLGRFVRERRDELGMNQGELGEAVGRDQKYISDVERGALVNLPPIEVLRPMAEALRCTTTDLLEAAGYIDASDEERFAALREASQIYDTERRLASLRDEVDAVLGMVRGMREDRNVVVEDGSP